MEIYITSHFYQKFLIRNGKIDPTNRTYKTIFGSKHAKQFNLFKPQIIEDDTESIPDESIVLHDIKNDDLILQLPKYNKCYNVVIIDHILYEFLDIVYHKPTFFDSEESLKGINGIYVGFYEQLCLLVELKQTGKYTFVSSFCNITKDSGRYPKAIELRWLKAIYDIVQNSEKNKILSLMVANVRDRIRLKNEVFYKKVYGLTSCQMKDLESIYRLKIPLIDVPMYRRNDHISMIRKKWLSTKIVDYFIMNSNDFIL